MSTRELYFLQVAIGLSRKGILQKDGGPFGSIVVKGDEIIGRGWNRVLADHDPTAHAEMVAIREACTNLQSFQLAGCEIYTSCEPCPMCLGAIYWARPDKVFFANTKEEAAAIGFDDSFIYREFVLPHMDKRIPLIHQPHAEALRIFQVWQEKDDKKIY